MATNSTITGILDYILNRASRYELELVSEALRKSDEGDYEAGE